ncbi:MAG TPA: HAD domain-containing protein [Stellaceae bacterium]|nr:HAD domain-containing protein [Stellaceae bacterium]
MEQAPKTIIVFFDLLGVFEEFTLVDQIAFEVAMVRPDSSYAEEGVRALNRLMRTWREAGHAVFLVCISGVRTEFTRESLDDYLLARGFERETLRLHPRHNTPKPNDSEDAPPATKGDEVASWLEHNPCDAWVVFDDFNDGYRKGAFVYVDAALGLSAENVELARAYVDRQLTAPADRR